MFLKIKTKTIYKSITTAVVEKTNTYILNISTRISQGNKNNKLNLVIFYSKAILQACSDELL